PPRSSPIGYARWPAARSGRRSSRGAGGSASVRRSPPGGRENGAIARRVRRTPWPSIGRLERKRAERELRQAGASGSKWWVAGVAQSVVSEQTRIAVIAAVARRQQARIPFSERPTHAVLDEVGRRTRV